MKIGIIDYGAGNVQSVMNALLKLNQSVIISNQIEELNQVDKIILPGVGNAKKAMEQLTKNQLVNYLKDYKNPILGICLGMQLLCTYSEENNTNCLDIIEGQVLRFNINQKVPKMGWNKIEFDDNELFKNIPKESYFYFVHSYYLPINAASIATAQYGVKYTSAIARNQYYGVQFHPEKSGSAGLQLLQNFIAL